MEELPAQHAKGRKPNKATSPMILFMGHSGKSKSRSVVAKGRGWGQGEWAGRITRGQEGICGDDGYTLYFNSDGGHITVCLSDFRTGHLKKDDF